MKFCKSFITSAYAIVAGALLASSVFAADVYPNKPVTLVVPFAAGGPTDAVARLIAVPMGKELGQSVIVENTVGAGGTIAATRVARSAPDGYMIFIHHMGMATAPALYKKLPFDPMKDFEYIGQVVDVPMVLLGRKNFPPNNFKELETYIKANKEKVTLANAGPGAVSQLCGLLFMSREGVELTTVPYKGTGPALTDTIAGQTQVLFSSIAVAMPQVRNNRLRAIAVTTPKRIDALPEVPTVNESGLKGYETVLWHGLIGPKNLPRPIVDRLNGDLNKILQNKDMQDKLAGDGVTAAGGTPEQFGATIKRDIDTWRKVVQKAGVKAD